MVAAEEYVVKIDKERNYLTSKTGSDYVYINSSNLSAILSSFYYAGYIKCMKDVNDRYEKFLNSSTQLGGYDMDTDIILNHINNLSEKLDTKIDKLDSKYDNKIDNLSNKLDDVINNLNNNFNNLNREVGELNTKVDDIKEKNSFKSKYLIAPIITSIMTSVITAILMKVFLK